MKILQICNYYFPHVGGIEQVAKDVATSLKGEGEYTQKVFCFNHENKDKTEIIDGTEVVRAGSFAKISSQSISLSYGKLLKKTFKDFNPDVVIFHYPNPFAAMYLLNNLKKRPNCKLILYWHLDITKQKILGKFFVGQTNRLLNRAEKVIATSPNYLHGSKHLPDYREKCVVIPNCVNDERVKITEEVVARAKKITSEYENEIILFAVGRHVPYKGMEYLVQASKYLPDNYAVIIGGSGELTESLKDKAKEDKKVVFTGRLADDDLKAYMLACDIFCFPSVTKNEAFGIALAEAMAFAKPAVTFTVNGSGVNFVNLDGVTGLEVENANSKAFAQAVVKIAENDKLRLNFGKAAKKRVEENFTFEKFKSNIKNLLINL